MPHIIDLIALMRKNHPMDIIHFERLVSKEIGKPVNIIAENGKIMMYHNITCRVIGEYKPSPNFIKLGNAFIEFYKGGLKINVFQEIKQVFKEFGINVIM